MNKIACSFLCLFILYGVQAFAQNSDYELGRTTSKYSNEFLSIGVGAAAQGMGNTQSGVVSDVTAGYWNPAGLVNIQPRYQFALMHAELFAGIANYDYAGFATAIDSSSYFGLSFIRLGVDNIPDTRYLFVADVPDYTRIRSFSSSDNALLLSYAKKDFWLKGLNVGANFKIIYRNAGNFANAWGFGLDAGAQYRKNNWMLGLMARDVTSTFNAWSFNSVEFAEVFKSTGNTIPESSIEITLPKWILGIGRQFQFGKNFGILATADFDCSFDGKRNVPISTNFISIDPRAGLEANYKQTVYLRGGISNIQEVKSLDNGSVKKTVYQPNFGIGLRFNRFTLDYALTQFGDKTLASAGNTSGLYSNIFSLKFGL